MEFDNLDIRSSLSLLLSDDKTSSQERASHFTVSHEVVRNGENAHGAAYSVRCSARRCSVWIAACFVVVVRGFHVD